MPVQPPLIDQRSLIPNGSEGFLWGMAALRKTVARLRAELPRPRWETRGGAVAIEAFRDQLVGFRRPTSTCSGTVLPVVLPRGKCDPARYASYVGEHTPRSVRGDQGSEAAVLGHVTSATKPSDIGRFVVVRIPIPMVAILTRITAALARLTLRLGESLQGASVPCITNEAF